MKLSVNGEDVMLDGPCSVARLLRQYELDAAPCAVEVNKALIPKREHEDCALADGDIIEIVTLVGGG